MMPLTAPVRQDLMIIVHPDRSDLLPRLRAQFRDAMIIFDRRRGDRRQTGRSTPEEQRKGGDRRQPVPWSEQLLYQRDGYKIVCRVRDAATPASPD